MLSVVMDKGVRPSNPVGFSDNESTTEGCRRTLYTEHRGNDSFLRDAMAVAAETSSNHGSPEVREGLEDSANCNVELVIAEV